MNYNNNPPNNAPPNYNPFISAYPSPAHTNYSAPMNNVYNNPPIVPPQYVYVPPPMYQRAKTTEELERERKDAELARALADQKSPTLNTHVVC